MTTIPDHPHVPACDVHACAVCQTCGRVHHDGGDQCIHCWVDEHTKGDEEVTGRKRELAAKIAAMPKCPTCGGFAIPSATMTATFVCRVHGRFTVPEKRSRRRLPPSP